MNRLCSTRIHSDATYFRLRTQSSVNETERVRMMQLVIFKRVGPREHSSRDRVVKQYINVKTIRNILDCETFRRIVRFDSTPAVVVSPWRISVVFRSPSRLPIARYSFDTRGKSDTEVMEVNSLVNSGLIGGGKSGGSVSREVKFKFSSRLSVWGKLFHRNFHRGGRELRC